MGHTTWPMWSAHQHPLLMNWIVYISLSFNNILLLLSKIFYMCCSSTLAFLVRKSISIDSAHSRPVVGCWHCHLTVWWRKQSFKKAFKTSQGPCWTATCLHWAGTCWMLLGKWDSVWNERWGFYKSSWTHNKGIIHNVKIWSATDRWATLDHCVCPQQTSKWAPLSHTETVAEHPSCYWFDKNSRKTLKREREKSDNQSPRSRTAHIIK